MRRDILITILFGILVFWLDTRATVHDKLAIRNAWRARMNDTVDVSLSDLPKWYLLANTNIQGWAYVVDERNLVTYGANSNNYSKAAFDAWKSTHLDNPDCFQVRHRVYLDWEQVQADEGMGTVTN